MGMAVGAALAGQRPVVEVMFIDFITLAMDQLVNHAAKLRYMSGGLLSRAPRHPRPGWRAGRHGRAPQPEPGGVVHARARAHRWWRRPRPRMPAACCRPPSAPTTRCSTWSIAPSTGAGARCLTARTPRSCRSGGAIVRRPGTDVTIVSLVAHGQHRARRPRTRSRRRASRRRSSTCAACAPLDLDTVLASVGRTGRLRRRP